MLELMKDCRIRLHRNLKVAKIRSRVFNSGARSYISVSGPRSYVSYDFKSCDGSFDRVITASNNLFCLLLLLEQSIIKKEQI